MNNLNQYLKTQHRQEFELFGQLSVVYGNTEAEAKAKAEIAKRKLMDKAPSSASNQPQAERIWTRTSPHQRVNWVRAVRMLIDAMGVNELSMKLSTSPFVIFNWCNASGAIPDTLHNDIAKLTAEYCVNSEIDSRCNLRVRVGGE